MQAVGKIQCGGCFLKGLWHSSVGRTGPEVLGMDVCEGKSVYRKRFRTGWAMGSSKV